MKEKEECESVRKTDTLSPPDQPEALLRNDALCLQPPARNDAHRRDRSIAFSEGGANTWLGVWSLTRERYQPGPL